MANETSVDRRRLLGVAGLTSLAALVGNALPARGQGKARFPAIRRAIKEMKEAISELEEGRKIFGGHRVKAIKAMKAAIEECEAAIRFAEKGA